MFTLSLHVICLNEAARHEELQLQHINPHVPFAAMEASVAVIAGTVLRL